MYILMQNAKFDLCLNFFFLEQMQDSTHLQKFNHSFSLNPALNAGGYKNKHSEHLDFFLVLDLEGKVEILEFPVLMIDAKTMDVVAFFHR